MDLLLHHQKQENLPDITKNKKASDALAKCTDNRSCRN